MLSSARTARVVLLLVIAMAFVLIADVGYAATHRRDTSIEPCALVLTREHGPACR